MTEIHVVNPGGNAGPCFQALLVPPERLPEAGAAAEARMVPGTPIRDAADLQDEQRCQAVWPDVPCLLPGHMAGRPGAAGPGSVGDLARIRVCSVRCYAATPVCALRLGQEVGRASCLLPRRLKWALTCSGTGLSRALAGGTSPFRRTCRD